MCYKITKEKQIVIKQHLFLTSDDMMLTVLFRFRKNEAIV